MSDSEIYYALMQYYQQWLQREKDPDVARTLAKRIAYLKATYTPPKVVICDDPKY